MSIYGVGEEQDIWYTVLFFFCMFSVAVGVIELLMFVRGFTVQVCV